MRQKRHEEFHEAYSRRTRKSMKFFLKSSVVAVWFDFSEKNVDLHSRDGKI